jgi:DNA-binding NtrC family response regulator
MSSMRAVEGSESTAKVAVDVPRRVLIVDDDPSIVGVMSEFLTVIKPNYTIVTASNADDALESVRRDRPDLVLLDFNMPGLDGVEALKQMTAHDPAIRVIMVTGSDFTAGAAALKNGAVAYLPKPFNLKYLEQLVAIAIPD